MSSTSKSQVMVAKGELSAVNSITGASVILPSRALTVSVGE
jgi:hypothetical protein